MAERRNGASKPMADPGFTDDSFAVCWRSPHPSSRRYQLVASVGERRDRIVVDLRQFLRDEPGTVTGKGFQVPADFLPELRAALDALEAEVERRQAAISRNGG